MRSARYFAARVSESGAISWCLRVFDVVHHPSSPPRGTRETRRGEEEERGVGFV